MTHAHPNSVHSGQGLTSRFKKPSLWAVTATLLVMVYGLTRQNMNGANVMESAIAGSGASETNAHTETFIYSGGCFWCAEADSEKLDGVTEVISGFTGGTTKDPKYYSGK